MLLKDDWQKTLADNQNSKYIQKNTTKDNDMKNQKKFNTSLIFLGVVISILVVFIIQLMRHVQSLLELDTKINLTEIVSQNKESITNRLTLNIQSVEVLASQLSDEIKYKQLLDKNLDIQEAINEFGIKTNSNNVFIANAAGTVFRKNRQPIYITGRKYFRTSMTGRSNISDQIISRLDGEDIFIISAPIMIKNNPVGSVQKILTKSEKCTKWHPCHCFHQMVISTLSMKRDM